MDTTNFGACVGEICNRNGCLGIIETTAETGCSCHINPPCHSCTADVICSLCDYNSGDDYYIYRQEKNVSMELIVPWGEKVRRWDGADILYEIDGSWHSGMYIKGVAPLNYKGKILQKLGYTDDRYMANFSYCIEKEKYIEFKFSVFTD